MLFFPHRFHTRRQCGINTNITYSCYRQLQFIETIAAQRAAKLFQLYAPQWIIFGNFGCAVFEIYSLSILCTHHKHVQLIFLNFFPLLPYPMIQTYQMQFSFLLCCEEITHAWVNTAPAVINTPMTFRIGSHIQFSHRGLWTQTNYILCLQFQNYFASQFFNKHQKQQWQPMMWMKSSKR